MNKRIVILAVALLTIGSSQARAECTGIVKWIPGWCSGRSEVDWTQKNGPQQSTVTPDPSLLGPLQKPSLFDKVVQEARDARDAVGKVLHGTRESTPTTRPPVSSYEVQTVPSTSSGRTAPTQVANNPNTEVYTLPPNSLGMKEGVRLAPGDPPSKSSNQQKSNFVNPNPYQQTSTFTTPGSSSVIPRPNETPLPNKPGGGAVEGAPPAGPASASSTKASGQKSSGNTFPVPDKVTPLPNQPARSHVNQAVVPAPNNLGRDISRMEPPGRPTATSPAPAVANPYRYQATSTGFLPPQPQAQSRPTYQTASYSGVAPRYGVGGVSLSKAAAERMPLNLSIESLGFRDDQVIIGGMRDGSTRIDAALFLTAMRTACGPNDPFFSLDPVDGAAWSVQGKQAGEAVWNRIEREFGREQDGTFSIQTFSVRQRYPALWSELAPNFPELRSRLVFRPEFLRTTRFGEILYKADVLLKELTTGVSIVQPNQPLRAATIPGYVPSDKRSAVRGILSDERKAASSYRLWFDLMPQADGDQPADQRAADSRMNPNKLPGLYAILSERGLVGGRIPQPIQRTAFYSEDGITDLSQVYPKMFVRRHDHATGQDLFGADPDRDRLSGDVNERTALYAKAYQELRDLTDIFRAYVASVKIVQQQPQICRTVTALPLSDGEKVGSALPDFHPSELALTIARYNWQTGQGTRYQFYSAQTINGGISLRGKEFVGVAGASGQTPIISEMKTEIAAGVPAPSWSSSSGRTYLAFAVDVREPPPRAPIVATR